MEIFKDIVSHCPVLTNLAGDFPSVVARLLAAMVENHDIEPASVDSLAEAVLRREEAAPTVFADGVAFPHARTNDVPRLRAAIGVSSQGLDWNAPDESRTHVVVLVLSPASASGQHLKFMAGLGRALLRGGIVQNLSGTEDANTLRQLLLS